MREWLYLHVFHSVEHRWRGLATWADHSNRERAHLALNGNPPPVTVYQLMAVT